MCPANMTKTLFPYKLQNWSHLWMRSGRTFEWIFNQHPFKKVLHTQTRLGSKKTNIFWKCFAPDQLSVNRRIHQTHHLAWLFFELPGRLVLTAHFIISEWRCGFTWTNDIYCLVLKLMIDIDHKIILIYEIIQSFNKLHMHQRWLCICCVLV